LSLELVDEIDGRVEAPSRSRADAAARDGDSQMRLARAGSADQDDVALLGDERAAREIAHERFVDRRVLEGEVVDVLGERQLGDRELVFDRASLLLRDLGLQEIAAPSSLRRLCTLVCERWGSCLRLSAVASVSS
jgi:hypothetical protein